MKKSLGFALRHPKPPTTPVHVLGILPDRLDAFTEDMDGIAHPDLVPWVVVVDAVEGRDVGDVLV